MYCFTGQLVIEDSSNGLDPFYESQENHTLIGVANIFLEALYNDVTLDYHTPIISQQGEVAGRLQVELTRTSGTLPQDRICEASSESSADSGQEDEDGSSIVKCCVNIKQASGLPLSLSHFVFCQYTFWNYPELIVVPSIVNPEQQTHQAAHKDSIMFKFNHVKEFTIPISEEFIEHCAGKCYLYIK